MQTHYTIIAKPHPAERSITLLLNGKFDEEAIRDLESSILEARCAHQHVYVDLSEVTLVDRKAVRYLSEQANRNIQLVNCPIYLRSWITQVSE
jgi:ABC-type transporter Mla MlaB component